MKRLFYLLIGLVLLPALLYAQGTLSLKDINDNLTNNYYNKTASDARYATTTYGYSSAEVDILLAPKADKTYVNATDEAIISDNDSQDVQIEANRIAITTKATTTDMDSAEAVIQLILADDDSQDVTIEANKVGVASLEVGLQTHQNNPTGAHAATAISATWTNVQNSLDSIEAAIQSIVVGSGFALESWVNSTLETNFYTKAQTNATIEAAIAAIPAPSVNQTITVTAGEALTAGQVVSLINESGAMKAYNNPLTVNTSPNGAESVFNAAATTYCSAVALDSTRFLTLYISGNQAYAKVGTISGSSISWGSESASIDGTGITYNTISKIGTDKVLAVYTKGSQFRAAVLSITTSTVAVNSPVNIGDYGEPDVQAISGSALENDKVVFCYHHDTQSKGIARIISVSGTVPSYSDPYIFHEFVSAGPSVNYISVSALSATSAIVAYQNLDNSGYGTAQVLSISGTTITPGTERAFKEAATTYTGICRLTDTTAAIVCNSSGGFAYVATNSSGALSFGAEATFTGSSYITNSPIDANHFLIATKVVSPSDLGISYVGTISGTSISVSSGSTYSDASLAYNSVCYLGSNKSVISYSDQGNSNYGTSVVNTWTTLSYASVSGISSGAYSSGSDAVVLISGVSDDQSGLITGSPYFLQSNFTIGTTPVSLTSSVYSSATTTREIKIGTAKSATELIIGIDYK